MLERGRIIRSARLKPIKQLFEQRKAPEKGWPDETIDTLLDMLASMDTDKDPEAARIGEREARVASPLLSRLACGFNHGVGRSGHIAAPQPKAPGASLMYELTNRLASDFLRRLGLPNIEGAIILPAATGMSLAVTLAALRANGNEVVYPRADHSSPKKGIQLVGLKEKTVEGKVVGDSVKVPVEDIERAIGPSTAAIVTTTSFFPPREPDDVKAVARIAEREKVPHIINNAYGVQSREIMKMIRGAIDVGRVDAIIQSTDKNFLTPVGGTVVASPSAEKLDEISRAYPGRASAAPIAQLLSAILSLGVEGYERLRDDQERNRELLETLMEALAKRVGERILRAFNPVAVAMTISRLDPKQLGEALFTLRVTGPRGLGPRDYGVCCPQYITGYVTMNAAIGATKRDVELAVERLEKAMIQLSR